MDSTVVIKVTWAMASTSPSNSRHSMVPLTATGMAIWATATPSTRGSVPMRWSTTPSAAGMASRRTAERIHIRTEVSTFRADMPASMEPSTSRESGMFTSPTISAMAPIIGGTWMPARVKIRVSRAMRMQGESSCFQWKRILPLSIRGPRE